MLRIAFRDFEILFNEYSRSLSIELDIYFVMNVSLTRSFYLIKLKHLELL